VRSVTTDPERAPLVQLAFDAYATGDYSISEVRDLLEEVGVAEPSDGQVCARTPVALAGTAQRWQKAATQDVSELQEVLEEALRLLRDPQLRYRSADAATQRLINQALFEKLGIRDDEVAEVKPSPWVIELHRAARSPLGDASQAPDRANRRRNADDPLSGAVVLNKARMVPRAGLEPAPPD
jgi:hypothetical protein